MRREGWHAIRVLTALVLCTWQVSAWAQSGGSLPVLVGSGSNGTSFSVPIQTLLFFTALSFLPAILLMMTGFTRIVIVLSLLRQALGTQSAPPNQVIIGLSLFLTFFVMGPTLDKVYQDAYLPYTKDAISFEQAVDRAQAPMRSFMLKQTRQSDFALFARLAKLDASVSAETAPMRVLIPAFVTSELKSAFQIGFFDLHSFSGHRHGGVQHPHVAGHDDALARAGGTALQAHALCAGRWVEPAHWFAGGQFCHLGTL